MSLGDSFLSGFNTTFGAGMQARDAKERKKQREEDLEFRKARAQIEDEFRDTMLANRGAEFAARQALEDERLRMEAAHFAHAKDMSERDFAFRRDQAADANLARLRAEARQARQDFSAEIDKARTDPLHEQILAEQARELQLRNDALADPKPKPIVPTRTRTYVDDDGAQIVERVPLGEFTQPGTGASDGAIPTTTFRTTDDVAAAYRAGKLTRAEAEHILKNQFGISR